MLTLLTKSYNTTSYNKQEKIQRIAHDYSIGFETNKTLVTYLEITSEHLETEDEFYSFGLLQDTTEF